MDQNRNILDHLWVLVRWRRMIIISVIIVTGLTAILSLILPEAYRAHAVVYPPQEGQEGLGLSSLLGNLPMGLLGMGKRAVSATDFVPILQSKRVAEAVGNRYKLKKRYKAESDEALLAMIDERLEVELSREQFLTVSFEEETPELTAKLTNAFVDELDRALQERRREQAASLRNYFERRLAEAKEDMLSAETTYNRFQNENMAIDLETQARAQLESASTLYSNLAELMIKREVATQLMEPGHPQLKQLAIEIAAASSTVERVLMGKRTDQIGDEQNDSKFPDVFIPFRKMPDLGLRGLQLQRDVEIHNAIYQFVLQEYEKSRFEEEKDTPLVIVMDRAIPPDTRSKPRRTLLVAVAGGLSLAFSVLLAFTLESVRNLEGENRTKLDAIFSELGRK